MLIRIKGDLFKSDCDVIGHQSNCLIGYESGIAGQIRKKFPRAYKVFAEDSRSPMDKLGTYTASLEASLKIFNLYGQGEYGAQPGVRYTDYAALESALTKMMEWVKAYEAEQQAELKIGLPYLIGCGLAGGDWPTVENIIDDVSISFEHDIFI